MGALIAIDGVDASGKQTQTELLLKRTDKNSTRLISFPAYDKPSSAPVKMYLNGELGTNPDDVNAYAASALFAVDRYATYKSDWEKDYKSDKLIIADRYVSSNMIHQASKINNIDKKEKFLEWLFDLEYNKFGLPQPDVMIFLDMPPEYGARLMAERANKITGDMSKDIHENDKEYLRKSYDNALFVAKKYNWNIVSCVRDNKIREIDDINDEIYSIITKLQHTKK